MSQVKFKFPEEFGNFYKKKSEKNEKKSGVKKNV